jgi:MSHA biogenesis protein MshO
MSGRARGFTLVELITVMVILGILSIGTVRFITDSSSGFASTISRTELAGDARFAVERLGRALRDALPGSVRVNGSCIELIPVVAGSSYLTLPVATAAADFQAVPVTPLPLPANARVAVYPSGSLYQLSGVSSVSPTVSVSAPNGDNEVTVTMASAHRFPAESPSNRFFLVTSPVSYCVDGGALWRYQDYGFNATQPTPAGLPSALPGRTLITQAVSSPAPFSVAAATLARNAVVDINLSFERGGDAVTLQHLVQVRNVP